jgi:hypothetical protein
MPKTNLKRLEAHQKHLDKLSSLYIDANEFTYIFLNQQSGEHELYLQGLTHATCIGWGTLERCQRLANKVKTNPTPYRRYFKVGLP